MLRRDLEALDSLVNSAEDATSPCAASAAAPAQPKSSSLGFMGPQAMSTTPICLATPQGGHTSRLLRLPLTFWNSTPRASWVRRDSCAATDAGSKSLSVGSTAVFAGGASNEPCRCGAARTIGPSIFYSNGTT